MSASLLESSECRFGNHVVCPRHWWPGGHRSYHTGADDAHKYGHICPCDCHDTKPHLDETTTKEATDADR